MSQLPPALLTNSRAGRTSPTCQVTTTRYFIGDANEKVLLQHDEDHWTIPGISPDDSEHMNADAADLDLDAANYLEQVNHATNAIAWMINGPEQVAWLQIRDNTCAAVPDRVGCLIRITQERVQA